MIITAIEPVADAPSRRVVLADHDTRKLSGYRERPSTMSETLAFLRADEVSVADRGNVGTVVTFTVALEFERPIEAELFLHDVRSSTPRNARVEFESRDGGRRKLRYLSAAQIEITDLSYTGVSLEIAYQISGGAMQQT